MSFTGVLGHFVNTRRGNIKFIFGIMKITRCTEREHLKNGSADWAYTSMCVFFKVVCLIFYDGFTSSPKALGKADSRSY